MYLNWDHGPIYTQWGWRQWSSTIYFSSYSQFLLLTIGLLNLNPWSWNKNVFYLLSLHMSTFKMYLKLINLKNLNFFILTPVNWKVSILIKLLDLSEKQMLNVDKSTIVVWKHLIALFNILDTYYFINNIFLIHYKRYRTTSWFTTGDNKNIMHTLITFIIYIYVQYILLH